MILVVIAGVLLFFFACKGDEIIGPATGSLLRHTGCKEARSFSDGDAEFHEDCLEYRYADGTLYLNHGNAAFNCCPGEIAADFEFDGQTIRITEREAEAGCHCNCLFDLEMVVSSLSPGEYTLRVVEPYLTSADAPLTLSLLLENGTSGRFCVPRSQYPWET